MLQNYLDAMSLCKWFGYPDFFITFTCNPKWLEIKRFLKDTSIQPEDIPDILCRLFKIKLGAFIKDLRENHIFGKVQAYVYTIEFQKRGLPHCHICLFMHSDYKLPTVEFMDPIISVEIPDKIEDPELYPSVVRLPFHLPNQQQIVYGEDDDIDDVLDKPFVAASKFTSWMECNAINSKARELTCVELPTKFVWKLNGRFWKRKKIGKAIGRIHSISPDFGEAYFLRILLNKVKGPTSFDEIRTVNGETYSSFRYVCYALGLLDNDKEYIDAIKEASHFGSGFYLRLLFATLLICNSMSKPEAVWENT
ncbi:unnamed protein product [Lactuca virosa]|uniref:Helitron helicase-like domain-containing protein n=1 Tax=Lactuca virosa TaxID=75947 RepID=A0AAU9LSJ3_9ASTR|nr:unnamed protein product [Lactuca virosa]